MTLQIIGAGFGRTGTTSLKAALERLDLGPCEHMQNLIEHPERFALWNDAVRGKLRGGAIDWAPLFTGYRSTLDWPGAFFWRELANAYPGAKVILTVRDPAEWYASVQNTIYRGRKWAGPNPVANVLQSVAGTISPTLANFFDLVEATVWQGTFDGRFGERDFALQVFDAHIAAVERAIAPERLLVFNVREGWEPLCRFLEAPVPNEPFPHVNDAADMRLRMREQLAPLATAAAGAVLTAGGLAVLAWGAARKAEAERRKLVNRTGPGAS